MVILRNPTIGFMAINKIATEISILYFRGSDRGGYFTTKGFNEEMTHQQNDSNSNVHVSDWFRE